MFIDDPKVYLQMLRDSCGKFELVISFSNIFSHWKFRKFLFFFQKLDKMLSQLLKDGHKCLIFSQMTRMLDILQVNQQQ